MKKFYLLSFLMLSLCLVSYSQNNFCNTALPFCTGSFAFPAGVNQSSAESGPNYGCLLSQPNPAWYYTLIDTSGPINIHISTIPSHDVDIICWGPFTSPIDPCVSGLSANCTSCPNNTVDTTFYPSGNLVDCSFSTSWQEDCHIPNAIKGEFYIVMVTNYSNMACDIIFEQTNQYAIGHGTTDQTIVNQSHINNVASKKSDFSIFPNPLTQSTTVKFYNPEKKSCTLTVFDVTGKAIRIYKNIKTDLVTIEKGDLKNGIYFIEINGEKIFRGKLSVE